MSKNLTEKNKQTASSTPQSESNSDRQIDGRHVDDTHVGGLHMTRAFILCESALKRFIGRFLYRPEDVDELAQETFLRAYVASKTIDVRSPQAYLFRVAKNIALKELDRKSTRMTDFLEEALSEDALEGFPSAEDELIADQKLTSYCEAIATLTPQCRKVFLMRKVQAKSYREISEALNISISAVEKNISKGLERFDGYMVNQDQDYQRQSRALIVEERLRDDAQKETT